MHASLKITSWRRQAEHFFSCKIKTLVCVFYELTDCFHQHTLSWVCIMTKWAVYAELNRISHQPFFSHYKNQNHSGAKTWHSRTVMCIIKLKIFPVPVRLYPVPVNCNLVFILPHFAIYKNVVHSLEPGETPNYSASHQAPNYARHY